MKILIQSFKLLPFVTDVLLSASFGGTRQNAERANRHWSVLITWLIRILSLFPAVCIQKSATPTLSTIPNHIPNPNPKRNPTVITDPQIGPIDPQIVKIQIRPADPHFVLSQKKLEWWGYQKVEKVLKIGLAVLIQYRRVTDSQPPSQPRCRSIYRAYYVAQVKSDCD